MTGNSPHPAGIQATARPRLLVIDPTRIGDLNATGQFKKNLLNGWPEQRILQIFAPGGDSLALAQSIGDQSEDLDVSMDDEVLEAVTAFDPEVIYYRPTIDQHPRLHAVASEILERHSTPLVTHIADDWPSRLAAIDPARAKEVDHVLRAVLARSQSALSISNKMSAVLGDRYGIEFEPIANGVDVDLYRDLSGRMSPRKKERREVVIRYCGALARDMTFHTLVDVARAVDSIADQVAVSFEVYTMPGWRAEFENEVRNLRGVAVRDSVPDDEYPALITEADILVLGYNFDSESLRYIGLSMPNKLPEYLASGAAVLAVGPPEANGIDYLLSRRLGCCVTERDSETLTLALRTLVGDRELRDRLAKTAQEWALEHLDLRLISDRFACILQEAARPTVSPLLGPFSRAEGLAVDESEVIASLIASRRGGTMLDVGAHHGSASRAFVEAGWSVVACEPDDANRQRLVERFGGRSNLRIDPRAVSNQPAEAVAFFSSEESSGISALHAFRDTHVETARVEVTTVAELARTHGLSCIDFLKIDVEGHDWDVLRGVPWDQIAPDVIECEFEDAKTVPLGHTYRDIADYLAQRGYTVYLSEWHPTIRYGIRHEWRQLARYPAQLASADAWGNILAFRDDPGEGAIKAAFLAHLNVEGSRTTNGGGPKNTIVAYGPAEQARSRAARASLSEGRMITEGASRYERVYVWAKTRNPWLFVVGRLGMWCLRKGRRYPMATTATVGFLVALVAAGFLPAMETYATALWVAAGMLALGALFVAVVGFARFMVKETRHELQLDHLALQRRVERAERDLRSEPAARASLEAKFAGLEAAHSSIEASFQAQVDELRSVLEAKFAGLEAAHSSIEASFQAQVDELRSMLGPAPGARLSIDIISALRQVHPLWMTPSGVHQADPESEKEHGHSVLMAALVDEANQQPGVLGGRTLVEVGATREYDPLQGSTEKLAIFTALTGMRFISVDIDPANSARANQIIPYLNPKAEALTDRGERYLAACSEPLDYVYLDAFDFDHGEHSEERQARYRDVLRTEISNEASWRMHRLCAEALITKMPRGGIVVIDDTWLDGEGHFGGKGTHAVPLLLAGGFTIVSKSPRSIALKRTSDPPSLSADA